MKTRVLASLFAAVALLGSIPLWWWLHQSQTDRSEIAPAPADAAAPAQDTASGTTEAAADSSPPSEGETPLPVPAPDDAAGPARPGKPQPELITGPDRGRSPLADTLNMADGSITLDLDVVHKVLNNYLLEFGAYPVGSNREITAQLSGRNATRHAPLPPDLPAISAEGELVDRWGTPFFFHALSARAMEIRSAGPDRELYTDDDAVWTPEPR